MQQVTSDNSPKVVALKFLNLIGQNDNEGTDEIVDIFARAHPAFRTKKLAKENLRLRWLMDRWVRALRLDPADWRAAILLRGLLMEDMHWSQLAHLLKLSEARVRSLALDSLLEEVSSEDLMNRPSRDCARNDLYLIDVLTRQTWVDSLGIYPKLYFESHLKDCVRCRRVYERSEVYRATLLASRRVVLPGFLDWDEIVAAEALSPGIAIPRFVLPLRVVGTLGLVLLIFVGVTAAPYLDKLFAPKSNRAEVAPTSEPVLQPDPEPMMIAQNPEPEAPSLLSEVMEKAEIPASPAVLSEKTKRGLGARILSYIEEKTRSVTPLPKAPEPSKPVVAVIVEAKLPEPKQVVASTPEPVTQAKTDTMNRVFFRWGARAQDPERMTQKILGWLVELSAENAGELEFGALYRGGRYFHFMIPKSAYPDLLAKIKTLPLTDFSDAAAESDRSIAADRSRIVFWVGPTNP